MVGLVRTTSDDWQMDWMDGGWREVGVLVLADSDACSVAEGWRGNCPDRQTGCEAAPCDPRNSVPMNSAKQGTSQAVKVIYARGFRRFLRSGQIY